MAAYSATKGYSSFIIMQDATTFGGFLSQEEVSALSSSVWPDYVNEEDT